MDELARALDFERGRNLVLGQAVERLEARVLRLERALRAARRADAKYEAGLALPPVRWNEPEGSS